MILALLKTLASKTLNFIKLYWKQLLLVFLGVFITLKFQSCVGCRKPHQTPNSGPSSPTTQPVLPKGDKEVIKVDPTHGTTTITTDKGTTTVTGSRDTTVEVKDDGKVVVHSKTFGLCHNLMIGAGVNNTGVKGVAGFEWLYWKKLDLISGLGADKYLSHTALLTSVGYTPYNKIFHGNTSFWLGGSIDTTGTRSLMTGFAVRI